MLELMHDAGLRTVALVKTTEATMWKHGLKCWVPSVPAVTGDRFQVLGRYWSSGASQWKVKVQQGFWYAALQTLAALAD